MTVLRCVKLLVLLVLSTIHVALAHVSLTFPPARKYDLDFLDNSRTKAPCGMPKGSIQTTILAGSSFNVTWHLAYPHRGGFRLQLLDDLERPVLDLTPSVNGSEFVRTDATAQSFEVHIPNDFTCHNCTLRLLRQADEWSSGYRFWSCADIDIKERKDFRETCSGNGKYFPSRCKCNKNFYGARCQYQDECTTNQDCGVQGQCIDLKGTSLPKKQCYCNFGWFGPGCNKKSPYKTTDIDLSGYSMRQLSPDYQLHWRILEDIKEIEFVLKVNGTSWVGLGWRPNNMTATCKHFPNIQESEEVGGLRRNPEVAAEPEPEPEAAAEPEPEPEAAAEPEPKPEAAAEPEPEPEAAAEPEPEPEAAAEPEPEPKLTYEASSKTKRVAAGDDTTSKDGITVATSVSYRVSAKTGRKRRQAVTPSISPGNQGTGRPSIPTPEPTSEPEPASKSKDPTPEPNAEPEPASKSKDPTPEPNAEPEPASKSKDPTPEPNAEPEPASKSKDQTPEPNAEPEPASKSKDPTPEPTSEPEPENFPLPISKVQKSTAQSEGNYPSKAHPYTPRHDFNPMDCTDIVIGSARGKTSRVGDYYTRDRSTPRVDDFWGGKSDLTLGTGFEDNGVTTIIFRKKLESTEPTDYSFIDDLTHVIWAKGQEPGSYVHEPPSGLEKDASSIQEFYQPDELKYHGHKMQRGLTQMNFFEKEKSSETEEGGNVLDNECFGNWKYPKGCSQPDHSCEYYVSWETVGRGDAMRWYIETKHTQTWTGIGFSEDYKMSQTDAILGWVDRNGRHFLMDTTINGYSPPKIDEIQDIYNTSGRIEKGVTILEFTRKRNSNDKNQDLAFTEDHCLHLFFPVLGGAFNAVNKKIRKHEQIPFVTPERVCIKSCGKELETLIVGPITPTPSRLVYSVGVKLMNLAESFEAPEKGSPEFQTLASAVQDSFNGLLINIPGYHKLDIVNFEKDGTAMVAKMNAIFDKAAYEKGRSLKTNELSATNEDTIDVKDGEYIRRVFNESVTTGIVGSLTVDPHYLDFESLDYTTKSSSTESSSSFFQLSEVRLYTVLGCIAALVLIALIQASCTIYKTSKKNKNQKDQLIPNSAWKDYSSNTNYAFDAFGETEEKSNKTPSRSRNSAPPQTLQMSHSPTNKGQYYENNGRSSRFETNGLGSPDHHPPHYRYSNGDQIIPRSAYGDRAYSLPRTSIQHQGSMQQAYYTQDRRNKHNHHHTDRDRGDRGRNTAAGTDTPDFYFMPSQRKYSGEVVRVYVDYNKDPKH